MSHLNKTLSILLLSNFVLSACDGVETPDHGQIHDDENFVNDLTTQDVDETDPAPLPDAQADLADLQSHGLAGTTHVNYAYTPWTSEEYPPITCPSSQLALGFACSGGWCDNVSMNCGSSPGTIFGPQFWTSYFSDEVNNYRMCPDGWWVNGLACQGSNCDNISLQCVSTNRTPTACDWSGWFSEEDPAYTAPTGKFIRGVQCSGSYCDNKRYYICSM